MAHEPNVKPPWIEKPEPPPGPPPKRDAKHGYMSEEEHAEAHRKIEAFMGRFVKLKDHTHKTEATGEDGRHGFLIKAPDIGI